MIRETLSPIWDETIRMQSIVLYGNLEDIVSNPGTIVIDVFDNDLVVGPLFRFSLQLAAIKFQYLLNII